MSSAPSRAVPSRAGFLEGMPDLLTPADMAALTGQSECTMRRLCRVGALPSVRIGKRWYVPKARLAEMAGVGGGA